MNFKLNKDSTVTLNCRMTPKSLPDELIFCENWT